MKKVLADVVMTIIKNDVNFEYFFHNLFSNRYHSSMKNVFYMF